MKLAYAPAGLTVDTITVAYVPADAQDWSTGEDHPNTGLITFSNDMHMTLQQVVAFNGKPALDLEEARLIALEQLRAKEEEEELA